MLTKHWRRLRTSLAKRVRVARLPKSMVRYGTRYGGWWVDTRKLGSAPVLIDVGLGKDCSFPEEFSRLKDSTVIGVEPNPESLEYCEKNCHFFTGIIPAAFWTESGSITYYSPQDAEYVSGSIKKEHKYVGPLSNLLEVPAVSLSQIFTDYDLSYCDVLKMDVEGAEYDLVEDLSKEGRLDRVGQLLIEFHHFCTDYSLEDTEEAILKLARCGFNLVHVEDRNYIFNRLD